MLEPTRRKTNPQRSLASAATALADRLEPSGGKFNAEKGHYEVEEGPETHNTAKDIRVGAEVERDGKETELRTII